MADIVILIEDSSDITKKDFDKMKAAVKELITDLDKMQRDKGQINLAVHTFASRYSKYTYHHTFSENKWPLDDGLKFMDLLEYHGKETPNMTHAILDAKDQLNVLGRDGVEKIVVYVGSGKGLDRSINVYYPQEIKVFGMLTANVDETGDFPEEIRKNVFGFYDQASRLGKQDTLLWIQYYLVPKCTQCENPEMDMAILMEDIQPRDKKFSNPIGKSYFEVAKELLSKSIRNMRVGDADTRIALVSYGDRVYENQTFGFNVPEMKKSSIVNTFQNLAYMNSKSWNVTEAFQYTFDNIFTYMNTRSRSTKMIVLVSRQLEKKETMEMVKKARRKGFFVYVAGIGAYSSRLLTDSLFFGQNGINLQENQHKWYIRALAQKTCVISAIHMSQSRE